MRYAHSAALIIGSMFNSSRAVQTFKVCAASWQRLPSGGSICFIMLGFCSLACFASKIPPATTGITKQNLLIFSSSTFCLTAQCAHCRGACCLFLLFALLCSIASLLSHRPRLHNKKQPAS